MNSDRKAQSTPENTPVPRPGVCGGYAKALVLLTVPVLMLVLAAIPALGAPAPPGPPIISRVRIEVTGATDTAYWLQMARNLIVPKAGERFNARAVRESIEALKQSHQFETIHVDSVPERQGLALVFSLKPFRLIRDIRIHGNYPLFDREVSNVMTLSVGNAFLESNLARQAELISGLYRRQGFIDPHVTVSGTPDATGQTVVIDVDIRKGAYWHLDSITFKGNHFFSDWQLKTKMSTWRSSLWWGSAGRFIASQLKKDVTALTHLYREHGFAEAEIAAKPVRHPASGSVSLTVTVTEGPRYTVSFIGNRAFGDRRLKKDLVLFTEGNRYDFGLRKSLKNLRHQYHQAGFLDARIQAKTVAGTDKSQRHIQFIIEEGPRTIVHSLRIEGVRSLPMPTIRKEILTRPPGMFYAGQYLPGVLDTDIEAIKALYRKDGFLEAQVKKQLAFSPNRKSVDITLNVDEKTRTRVASVKITGLHAISREKAIKAIGLVSGAPFRPFMVRSDENALSAVVADAGYPHVQVHGKLSFSHGRRLAAVVYQVVQGPFVRMGKTYFQGNFLTQKNVLENEIALRPGSPFSLKELLQSQKNLRSMNIFDSVQVRPVGLTENRHTVDLFVNVEEKPPYYLRAGTGYDSQRGAFANAKAGDLNLMGEDRDLSLSGELSQIGYRANLGLSEPRLLGSRFTATSGLFVSQQEEFNQNFGTHSLGASFGLERKWSKALSSNLNFRLEQRKQYALSPDIATTADLYQARTLLVATPSIQYDTRDSFIHPTKGMKANFSVDISKGLDTEVDNFLRYRFDISGYVSPLPRLTLAWIGRLGYLSYYGSTDSVPADQLFFLGGLNSVRGFGENLLRRDATGAPLGGRTAISSSLEARIDTGMNFVVIPFFDIGKVSNYVDYTGPDGFRASVGIGFGYNTPIGPLSIFYGQKLNSLPGESPGAFHFSIGYTF